MPPIGLTWRAVGASLFVSLLLAGSASAGPPTHERPDRTPPVETEPPPPVETVPEPPIEEVPLPPVETPPLPPVRPEVEPPVAAEPMGPEPPIIHVVFVPPPLTVAPRPQDGDKAKPRSYTREQLLAELDKARKLLEKQLDEKNKKGDKKKAKELKELRELRDALEDLEKVLSGKATEEEKEKLFKKNAWKLIKKGLEALGVPSLAIEAAKFGWGIGSPIGEHIAKGIEVIGDDAARKAATAWYTERGGLPSQDEFFEAGGWRFFYRAADQKTFVQRSRRPKGVNKYVPWIEREKYWHLLQSH